MAYADDVTVVIEASSQRDIQNKASSVLLSVEEWGARNRLSFFSAKSQTMTIKGRLKRSPTIKMYGASIASVSQARILGLIIDEARSYVQHASFIGERVANRFGKVSRVSASTWGIKYQALRILCILELTWRYWFTLQPYGTDARRFMLLRVHCSELKGRHLFY